MHTKVYIPYTHYYTYLLRYSKHNYTRAYTSAFMHGHTTLHCTVSDVHAYPTNHCMVSMFFFVFFFYIFMHTDTFIYYVVSLDFLLWPK